MRLFFPVHLQFQQHPIVVIILSVLGQKEGRRQMNVHGPSVRFDHLLSYQDSVLYRPRNLLKALARQRFDNHLVVVRKPIHFQGDGQYVLDRFVVVGVLGTVLGNVLESEAQLDHLVRFRWPPVTFRQRGKVELEQAHNGRDCHFLAGTGGLFVAPLHGKRSLAPKNLARVSPVQVKRRVRHGLVEVHVLHHRRGCHCLGGCQGRCRNRWRRGWAHGGVGKDTIRWFRSHRRFGSCPNGGWFCGGALGGRKCVARFSVQKVFGSLFHDHRRDNGNNQTDQKHARGDFSRSFILQTPAFSPAFRFGACLFEAIEFDRFFGNGNLIELFYLVLEIVVVGHDGCISFNLSSFL
mmetsp:Transcript_21982/g.45216  ORF Transcript_21982/g.45216 Transcript_21982/m.45216 type:complete len:350 (-) Transcript_21982:78-1127(-)